MYIAYILGTSPPKTVRWSYRNHIVSWLFQHHFWDGWLFNWFLSWPGRPKSRKARLAPAVEMVHRVHWPISHGDFPHVKQPEGPRGQNFHLNSMECHPFLGGFWVSWPQQCWGFGKDGLEWLAPSRIAMFGEIPLLFGCHGHLTTARTAAICTLFCLAPQLKSPQLHQVFFFVERERERVTSHFSWGYAAQHFCPALSRVSNVCGWWTSQVFLRSSLGWYLGALLPKALSTSTSFRCGSQKPAREVGQNSLPNRWNPLGCGWAQHFATVTQFQDLPLAFANLIWRWSTRHG